MDSGRIGAAAAVSDGKVFIAGGSAGPGKTPPTTIDQYVPTVRSQGAFQTLSAHLTTARQYGYAAPLPGGNVLFGGGTNQNGVDLASAEIYDPATSTDTPVTAAMTAARRMAWAAPLPDGRVLIGGGIDANNNIVSSAEIFDPTTGKFTATAQQMVDPLAGAAATALPDGRVLIVGGFSSTTAPSTTAVEYYNPTTGAFTKVADGLLVPRNGAVAVTLADGKVLIAGGISSAVATSPSVVERSAEIFDPEDSTSQELPLSGTTELTTARYAPVAGLLPNGKVLIAGGSNSTGAALAGRGALRVRARGDGVASRVRHRGGRRDLDHIGHDHEPRRPEPGCRGLLSCRSEFVGLQRRHQLMPRDAVRIPGHMCGQYPFHPVGDRLTSRDRDALGQRTRAADVRRQGHRQQLELGRSACPVQSVDHAGPLPHRTARCGDDSRVA